MTYRSGGTLGIYPDGFTGALLAGESIGDGAVILHGPTGCRGHHSAMSEHSFPRDDVPERLNFLEPFYFGQPRIPTTYLDGDDFVFGAKEKLVKALREIVKRNSAIITIVNSPGAALIGDNISQAVVESGVKSPCAVIEMPAISCSMADGYQQGTSAILEALSLTPSTRKRQTVVLVGLSIAHCYWEGSVAELRRLLALCGIEVLCAIGAGSNVNEYRQIPRAACYAVIHDEYADRIVPWLAERYGGSAVSSAMGAPVGFSATAAWIEAVASALGTDPTPALEDILARRRHVSRLIGQVAGSSAIIKGMTFAVRSDTSIALPLAKWLYEYVGLLPVAVETPDCHRDNPLAERLRGWLLSIGCEDAWQVPWHAMHPDLFFGDGQHVEAAKATGVGGIEVVLPASAYLNVVPKSMLGAVGSAWFVEHVLRELRWVLWL